MESVVKISDQELLASIGWPSSLLLAQSSPLVVLLLAGLVFIVHVSGADG